MYEKGNFGDLALPMPKQCRINEILMYIILSQLTTNPIMVFRDVVEENDKHGKVILKDPLHQIGTWGE